MNQESYPSTETPTRKNILVLQNEDGPHVFDEAGLLKRLMGNDALAREIARLFEAKTPRYIAELQKSLAVGNTIRIQQLAHTLKGAASSLGANKIAALAAELEKLGTGSRLDKAAQAMQQLTKEFECLTTLLTERGWIVSESPQAL